MRGQRHQSPSSKGEPTLPLTIFRLRSDRVADFEKEFSSESRLELAPPLDGYLLSFEPAQGEPLWAGPLASVLRDRSGFAPFGQSPSAMLVVRDDGQT